MASDETDLRDAERRFHPRAARPGAPPDDGPAVVAGVQLPAGSRPLYHRFGAPALVSTLWQSNEPLPDVLGVCRRLADAFPDTGLWPLVLRGDPGISLLGSFLFEPQDLAEVDCVDAAEVLRGRWEAAWGGEPNPHREPLGTTFPGLAEPGALRPLPNCDRLDPFALVDSPTTFNSILGPETLLPARLGLVPCTRPADIPALLGWLGATNSFPVTVVSAVLRSWEDRFGAVLVALDCYGPLLAIGAPPASEEHAMRVAAEWCAFASDLWIDAPDMHAWATAFASARAWVHGWD